MISANSENEQATTITLTETELEGIYGGWRGYGREMGFRGGDDGEQRFSYRSSERFSFRGDDERSFSYRRESFSYRGYDRY